MNIITSEQLKEGQTIGGGHLGSFRRVCAAGDSKLAPRSKKNSPKIDTPFYKWANFLIPRSRIHPKTETQF